MLTTKCGYDLSLERKGGGQNERPQDWEPKAVREQLEESLTRLGTDRIDLYQLHNARIEPVLDDDLWAELETLRAEGKVLRAGCRTRSGDRMGRGGRHRGRHAAHRLVADGLQRARAGAGTHVREPAPRRRRRVRADLRVSRTRRTPFRGASLPTPCSSRPTIAPTATATTCSTTSRRPQSLSFLWEPETGRTIGQAAVAGILANPAFTTVLPTVVTVEEIEEYAAASELPLTDAEHRSVTSCSRATSTTSIAT